MGSLRYPGGSTANSWNITSGRWVNGTGWDYKVRNEGLPAGTYTPKKFMAGIGGLLPVAPIWNLNMVTVPDPPSQLDELKAMGVPVEFVELGNENIDEPPAPYLARAKAVVARTRHLFPNATISVIGCFGDNWANCSKMLKQAYESVPRLFDAVTIHMYSPTNSTITKYAKTDAELRTATLAAVGPALSDTEWKVSQDIAATAPIWLDEFNWVGTGLGLRGLARGTARSVGYCGRRTPFKPCMSRSLHSRQVGQVLDRWITTHCSFRLTTGGLGGLAVLLYLILRIKWTKLSSMAFRRLPHT